MASGMDKGHAISQELLENESFTSEEAGPDFLVKGNGDLGSISRAEKRVLLTKKLSSKLRHVDGNDFSGIRCRKCDTPFVDRATVAKMGHEDGFSGDDSFSGGEELAHDSLIRFGSVAHFGLKTNILLHVIHGSGLGDDGLAGIQFNFHDLHVSSHQFIVNFVALLSRGRAV